MPANPQYVVLFHHFRAYLEAAAAAGVDVAPLKGAHLLANVYPPGADRGPLSDVDFLVREEQWGAALAIAERLGWRRLSRRGEGGHEAGLSCPAPGGRAVLFEAHRALFDPARYPLDHAALWSRAIAGTFDGAPCRALSPEDHFAHLAIHEVHHRLASLPRTLRDLGHLLAAGGVSGERLAERAREWRGTRAVWLALDLLSGGRPEPEPVARRSALEPPFAPARAAKAIAGLALDGALDGIPYRIKAALVWPPLFDSGRDLARFVLNRRPAAGA